jgi:hypothetical protein
MFTWLIRGVVAGVVAGVSYAVGRRRGGQAVARHMIADPAVGRAVIDRLAIVHGIDLSELIKIDESA